MSTSPKDTPDPVPASCSPWEFESLRKIHDDWHETFVSIIYVPPGEVTRTKGPWTDYSVVADFLAEMRKHHPTETTYMVVSSRCGHIHAEDADEWLKSHCAMKGRVGAEAEYIKRGICDKCGACSTREAEKKCRPSPFADAGSYSCPGDLLWEDESAE